MPTWLTIANLGPLAKITAALALLVVVLVRTQLGVDLCAVAFPEAAALKQFGSSLNNPTQPLTSPTLTQP